MYWLELNVFQTSMMNLVQYIFDFNESVDSTSQMASSTGMTLLDVKVPMQDHLKSNLFILYSLKKVSLEL